MRQARILLPALLLLAAGLLATLGLLYVAVWQQDRDFATNANLVVNRGLTEWQRDLAASVVDYAWGDAAARNLSAPDAPQWIAETFPTPIRRDYLGIDAVVVLDGADQVIAGSLGTATLTLRDLGPAAGGFDQLVRSARAISIQTPQPAVGYVALGGQVMIAAAASVLPSAADPSALQAVDRGPVIVFMRALSQDRLEALQRYVNVEHLAISATAPVIDHDSQMTNPRASGVVDQLDWEKRQLTLKGADGSVLGYLVWLPQQPGHAMLSRLLPQYGWVCLLVAALGAVVCIQAVRQERRAQAYLDDRRRHELELIRARREAERANRAKSDFLAGMSHELRTPLNAILGFSDAMLHQIFGPTGDSRYQDYLRAIRGSGQHLLSLINDALDLSKIEAGRMELHPEPQRTAALVEEVAVLMRSEAERAGIRLELDLDHAPEVFIGDGRAIRQVLLNLLSNALKFTPTGGRILVRARLVQEADPQGRGGVSRPSMVFTVEDDGIGMTAADLAVALEPFGQVDSQVARRTRGGDGGGVHAGTGLGLPISKKLVELHGGRLEIASAPQRGTAVTIHLPQPAHPQQQG